MDVDVIEPLRKLQAIDGELYRLRRDASQKPLELEAARRRVADEQTKAHALEAQLKTLQMKQKEKEIELSGRETTIQKLQGQLFQVKTNKEYTAMKHEIDQSKADISLFEEEILTILDEVERAKQAHRAQLGVVAAQQQRLGEEEVEVGRALAQIEAHIAELEQRRQAAAPGVQRDVLSTYERVLVSREGLALVPLINDSCGGCHMVQPPQVFSEASLRARVVTCDSCNRILYVDQSDAAAH